MSIMPIYIYGNEVLKKKTKPVPDIDDNKIKLLMDMMDTLKNASGFGLAANQVGISSSLAVIDLSSISDENEDEFYKVSEEYKKPIILFNPEIIKGWDEYTMEEGCLSIPELRAEVSRPKVIKLKFRDGEFNEKVLEIDGVLARVVQHELDHLNGKLFVERVGKIKSSLIKRRLKNIEDGKFNPKYPVQLK